MARSTTRSKTVTPDRLWRVRLLFDEKQKEFGKRLGLSGVEISRKETGDTLISIAQGLAVECLLRQKGLWTGNWKDIPLVSTYYE